MKIIKAKDYNDMSRKAANIISAQIITKPNCVLGLATGSTPIGTYARLVEQYKAISLFADNYCVASKNNIKGLMITNDGRSWYNDVTGG